MLQWVRETGWPRICNLVCIFSLIYLMEKNMCSVYNKSKKTKKTFLIKGWSKLLWIVSQYWSQQECSLYKMYMKVVLSYIFNWISFKCQRFSFIHIVNVSHTMGSVFNSRLIFSRYPESAPASRKYKVLQTEASGDGLHHIWEWRLSCDSTAALHAWESRVGV